MQNTVAIYTLMPDYGSAFEWVNTAEPTSDEAYLSGGDETSDLYDQIDAMPADLRAALEAWQLDFERHDASDSESKSPFDWSAFHARGLALALRVRAALGPHFRVVYEKPVEDPGCDIDERREVLADGSLRALPSRAEIMRRHPKRW